MTGQIFSILVAPEHGVAQTPMPSAELQADVGLVGDRYAGSGVVSLIEREGIDAFKTETGLDFADEAKFSSHNFPATICRYSSR